MSATSQAIGHWHMFEQKRSLWASRLPDFVHSDFPVADHIAVTASSPVCLTCTRCDARIEGMSAHLIGSFLDHHNHCGESQCDLWRCPNCHAPEFAERYHCRICEHENTGNFFRGSSIAPIELRERFEVERDAAIAARYEVNSLREALRCARAQFPHEAVTIRLGSTRWGVGHVAK